MVAGALIGALAYRLLGPSKEQADQIKTELDAARETLESYKASVNQHFSKTSELVNDLTQNYVKVHQHLAEGAHTLGDNKTFTNLLEQNETSEPIAVGDEANIGDAPADDSIVDQLETQPTPEEAIDVQAEVLEEVTEYTDPEAQPEAEVKPQRP